MRQALNSFAWLQRLRWLAIGGQGATLIFASGWLQLPIQWAPLLAVMLTTIVTNLSLSWLPVRLQQDDRALAGVLVADVFLLTALLQWSGGPENPFSILYLLHVVLAAVLLPPTWAAGMAGLSSILFGLLFYTSAPVLGLHIHMSHDGSLSTHLVGMWAAFSIVAFISVYCVTRISAELRRRERETATLMMNHQRLASLTTLAAGAAHELATPLSTMAIVLGELLQPSREPHSSPELTADLELMAGQLGRCREIIERMRGYSGETSGEMPAEIEVSTLLGELTAECAERFGDRVVVETAEEPLGLLIPVRTVLQSLVALVKNGVEATGIAPPVVVRARREHSNCRFEIVDRGEGIAPEIAPRIGEPFFTTKAPGAGMGLGVFLARLTADALGGSLTVRTTAAGTQVDMLLPCIARPQQEANAI